MTEDYKQLLLDYITELTPGQPSSEELFQNIEETERDKYVDFLPEDWKAFRFTGILKSKSSDKIILYGGYVETGGTYTSDSKGIIVITDGDLNPIQTIYEFSSGTKLRPIQCMYQEEDGQFVAVDSTIMYRSALPQDVKQAMVSNEKRIIMLNDVSIPTNDEYQVNLRKAYALTGVYTNFICKDIFKNPSTSHYAFVGMRMVYQNNRYDPDGTRVIQLKVNVGSSNEWNVNDTQNDYLYGGSFVYFDSDDVAHWKVLITNTTNNNQAISVWEGVGTTVSGNTLIYDPDYQVYIDSSAYNNQVAFINENKAYFVMNNQRWGNSGVLRPKYIGLFEIDLQNYILRTIYLKSLGNYDYTNLEAMYIQALNGELYINYVDNVQYDSADYYIQRYEGIWNPIFVKQGGGFTYNARYFYVSQSFNLLRINLIPTNPEQAGWFMSQITEVYNIANYNGLPYTNYNGLKGKYVNIYSDNKLVFSRNLHNISITNNYSISTVEVPNTYLNNMNLNPKDLVGETNVKLIADGNTISKNIYEVLYLNYINTITVKDNEDNIVKETGRYINTNINTGTQSNQADTKCTKVRINYTDSTSKVIPITWRKMAQVGVVGRVRRTEFTIYVEKAIENIEFISQDETTTYITVQRELEVGKYYTLKQAIKVVV